MNPVIFMTALGILINVILSFGVHHGEYVDSDGKLPCKLQKYSLIPRPSHVFQRYARKIGKAWSIL